MKNRNILIVTEGPDDAKVMKKVLNAYGIYANHNIYEYQTNIYCLYDVIEENSDGDWEQINLPLLLKSRETNDEKKEMLTKVFTDIILIFDFDPQHTTYEFSKINKLANFFSDAGEYGKLYIDYPMIESISHFVTFPNDNSYKNRIVTKSNLVNHEYKEIVHNDNHLISNLLDLKNKGVVDNVIQMNLMKTKHILDSDFARITTSVEYLAINQIDVLKKQAELYDKSEIMYVLCTCIFYLLDFDPKRYFG